MSINKKPRIDCHFKFKSKILILGLFALSTVTQWDSASGEVLMTEEHCDSIQEDAQGVTAGGDVCNDSNDCTDDTINQFDECVYVNNTDPCNDNTVCTTNDRCSNGHCGGLSINCNDNNACTNDSCHPTIGCIHVNTSIACFDGIFCNGRDTCSGGSCALHSGNPCPPNVACDEATQSCGLASVISFKAVKINNVPITPGTCNLALAPPKCSTGNLNKLCGSDAECHVGTSNLMPNRCAGGPNINLECSTNANCPGSTCILVLAGDTIEVELFLARWVTDLPAGVRLFQVKLDETSFVSPDNGTVLPMGWCAPVNKINCTDSTTCPLTYPICAQPWGCTCAGHSPDLGAMMTTSRTDYLLNNPAGIDTIDAVVISSLNFRYFAIAINDIGILDSGVPRYLGTLILKVSPNACGTFTIGSVQEINVTFISDSAPKPNTALPTLVPLLLTVDDCSRQLLSCNPDHCKIDARIAHDRLNQDLKKNTNSTVMTFSKPTLNCTNAPARTCILNSECPPGGTCTSMTAADFVVTVVPFDPINDILPVISAVTPNGVDPKKATISLNRRVQQSRWTCILDKGSNKRCCMGSLPADADNSRFSQPNDVFEIIDNLHGVAIPSLTIEKCDTDRSLQCSPADLLMVVDELNGADAFIEVNGDSLPTLVPSCPDMRLPP